MKVLASGCRTGKTTELMRLAARGSYYMVVRSQGEARRVADLARDEGLNLHFPITFDEYLQGSFVSRGIRGFVFDGAADFLAGIARGVPLVAVSIETD